MKRYLLILILGLCISTAFAQRDNQKWYLNGIGGRIETGASSNQLMGIDYSHFIKTNFGLNAFYISNWDFTTSCIYEGGIMATYNAAYPNLPSRLRWYVGGGLQIAGNPELEYDGETKTGDWNFMLGPSGVIGTGYVFKKIPINLCVEWRPSCNIVYTQYNKDAPNSERMNIAVFAFTLRFVTGNKYR